MGGYRYFFNINGQVVKKTLYFCIIYTNSKSNIASFVSKEEIKEFKGSFFYLYGKNIRLSTKELSAFSSVKKIIELL